MKTRLPILLAFVICQLSSAAQTPSYVPQNGLLGWWPFTGNAADSSGNSNDGTVFGATLTTDRFGNAGSAYNFDGVDDYISGSTSNLDVSTTNRLTISLWVNITSFPGNNVGSKLFTHSNPSFSGQQYALSITGSTNVSYFLAGTGDFESNGANFGNTPLTQGNWHHLVVTYTGTSVDFYLDGVLDTSKAETDVFPSTPIGEFFISSLSSSGFNTYFNGDIDDIGVWNRSLTICEIQDLYNASLGSTSSVTQNSATLTADATGGSYQWLECDGGGFSPLTGETNQSFTASTTGSYAVEVNLDGCVDTSECVVVDFTSINEISNLNLNIYPNPTDDIITLHGALNQPADLHIRIIDINGRVIRSINRASGDHLIETIDMSSVERGVYNLEVVIDGEKRILRVVKE